MPNRLSRLMGKVKRGKLDAANIEDARAEASVTTLPEGVGPLITFDKCEGGTDGFDIVFVHGLRGSRVKTWSSGDVFWPRDLLQHDVRRARGISWGYDASIAKGISYASKDSIYGHAETLLNDLDRIRKGITRPLLFVCHSLGGLVVKEALIISDSYNNHREDHHHHLGEIYASTIGVVFLGTPHRGSGQETLAQVVAKIAQVSLRKPNKQLLATLNQESHILESQRERFKIVSGKFRIVCFREELPTAIGLIVKETSASYDGNNVRREAIHANHMDMVRFSSKDDEGYKRTLHHIIDICESHEYQFRQRTEEIETRENEILGVLEFSSMTYRKRTIDNAYGETCSWIFDEPADGQGPVTRSQFSSWLQSDETFFWISGKAGCGKSTLMKYIFQHDTTKHELRRWADGRDLVLAGHFFFDRGNDNQKSREGMLRNILYQILDHRRELLPMVFGQYFTDPSTIPSDIHSWIRLRDLFLSTLDNLQDSKVCLFLDGLDEYRIMDRMDQYTEKQKDLMYDGTNEDEAWGQSMWMTEGHREIARFISQLINRGNVKICFASRELNQFEHEFRNFPRLQVHRHTADSIAQYCEDRLAKELPDLAGRSGFVSLITKKSYGVFLWVEIVVDMLIDGKINGDTQKELLNSLNSLPVRLGGEDGLYMSMMRHVRPEYLPESKRLFQLVMEWRSQHGRLDIITLFLAEEGHLETKKCQGLRVHNDVVCFQSWEELEPRWKTLERRLKSRCCGLLEGTDNVQFMHQTAEEFLSRKYLWDLIFHGVDGFEGDSVQLAMLSGQVRRLKICAEAVVNPDYVQSLQVNYWENLEISRDGSVRLYDALWYAHGLNPFPDNVGCYVSLLDELNNTGDELIKECKGLTLSEDATWIKFFVRVRRIGLTDDCWISPKSFLELATIYGCSPYIEAKVRDRVISQTELQRLLLRTVLPSDVEWIDRIRRVYHSDKTTAKILLEAGADPNHACTDSNADIAKGEGWTTWTSLLQVGISGERFYDVELWIECVILFLNYGADPTVQWHGEARVEDGSGGKDRENESESEDTATQIYTPDTAIDTMFGDLPEWQQKGYEQKSAKLRASLSKAKANWGTSQSARAVEDDG